MFRLACLAIGYFIGCVQSAYIIGKAVAKIDIREYESGNAGATNITRALGIKAGVAVFAFDVLKAILAYVICSAIFSGNGTFNASNAINNYLPGLYAGFGTILGHNFPFYLKFKGGKGAASTIGVLLAVNPVIAFISYAVGIIMLFATKYASVASLSIVGLFPILMIAFKRFASYFIFNVFSYSFSFNLHFGFSNEAIFIAILICALCYIRHFGNIKRLIEGNERKVRFKFRGGKN